MSWLLMAGFPMSSGARAPYAEEQLRGWIREASDKVYAKQEKCFRG
jgi:hypothetical protein